MPVKRYDNHRMRPFVGSVLGGGDDGLVAKMQSVERADTDHGMRPLGVKQVEAKVNLHERGYEDTDSRPSDRRSPTTAAMMTAWVTPSRMSGRSWSQ